MPAWETVGDVNDDNWLHEVVEAMPDGVVMVDDAGTIVLVNREIERLLGYDREQMLGQKVEMLIPADLVESHQSHRMSFQVASRRRAMGRGLDLFAQRGVQGIIIGAMTFGDEISAVAIAEALDTYPPMARTMALRGEKAAAVTPAKRSRKRAA